jgi:hypothetical protein
VQNTAVRQRLLYANIRVIGIARASRRGIYGRHATVT